MNEPIRRGRPPKAESPAPKKGKASWRPARAFHLSGKKPGFRYRFCVDSPDNISKKIDEGWSFVNPVTHGVDLPESLEPTSAAITSERRYRNLVLMALPEDVAKERDQYYNTMTDQQALLTPLQRAQRSHREAYPEKSPGVLYAAE